MAVVTKTTCRHCGTRFVSTPHRPDFCCAGCQFVFDLIQKNGLGKFYELQDAEVFPVKSMVFQRRDYGWLETLGAASPGQLKLDLQGISCIGCVWLIEKLFSRRPGSLALQVDSSIGNISLRYQPDTFSLLDFAVELQSYGYLLGPLCSMVRPRGLVIRLGICAALAMNAMLFTLPRYLGMDPSFRFAELFGLVSVVCGSLSFLIGGSYFIRRAFQSLRARVLHIDLPIALGLIAAYAGSIHAWFAGADNFLYFDFVSTFTFLMLVGRWVQQTAVERNRNRLLSLQLTVLEPKCGERFQIAPGSVIPVRSQLQSAAATLGLEWINGEAEARQAHLGQLVPAGAVNLSAEPLELEALEDWQDSLLRRLLEDSPSANRSQLGLEQFIGTYILIVLAIALLAFGGWWIIGGSLVTALQVLTSILVVSCPCAAGVALPLAEELAVSRLRKQGVFVREPSLWTRLARTRQIVFDKTGTLTMETMALLNPEALFNLSPELKRILLGMVRRSLHPVSCCLREQLLAEGLEQSAPQNLLEIVGKGLQIEDFFGLWRLGRPDWAASNCGSPDCVFALNHQVLAAFRFGEETRTDAHEEIAELRKLGFGLHILSGDRQSKVDSMAARVGLPGTHAHGELTPDEKAAWLDQHGGSHSLMIGDGANDSLAFNHSLCTGTPAIDRGLLEHKADFYFLGRGLRGIRNLFEMAASKRRATRGVLAFAITYNAIAIGLSICGLMAPLAAAILMPLSSLVTIAIVLFVFRQSKSV